MVAKNDIESSMLSKFRDNEAKNWQKIKNWQRQLKIYWFLEKKSVKGHSHWLTQNS